jgi:two-component system cell cycle sensor histidine kinase/response regulator CckA
VEDNPADSDLIREYLSEISEFQSNLHCVSTLGEAKRFLSANSVHAVLVDLSLPDSLGLDTVREVVGHLRSATAIVLTSLDDKATAMDAIGSGAQDYILKGAIDPDTLARVIRFSLQRSKWLGRLTEVQEQLYQSQKMESIGRMAGGIAHDFNNQLGAIGLLCSLVEEALGSGDDAKAYVGQIEQAVERAADLTRRLMVFCRQHPIELKAVDLSQLVQLNNRLYGRIFGASVELKMDCESGAFVLADSGLLEQAFMNLAINARDAMGDGTGGSFHISVRVQPASEDQQDFVVMRFQDSGCGIDPRVVDKIFEPFFTTKEVGKGTGLGLSMVYGTVRRFGGQIQVESTPGKGTAFILRFPRCTPEAPAVASKSASKIAAGGSERILLVEDEDALRKWTAEILTRNGYQVVEASNGAEALEIFEQSGAKFDLLIADMVMPKVGGIELSQKARAHNPHVQVLFTSGYSEDAHQKPGASQEKVHFLPKPASSQDLLAKIRQVLG